MFEITGKYNKAKVFADTMEESCYSQLIILCNQQWLQGCNISIMPDVHAGKGSVIGFTSTYNQKLNPNIIGVDIGCGVTSYKLFDVDSNQLINDFPTIDDFIHNKIPHGTTVHSSYERKYIDAILLENKPYTSLRFEKTLEDLCQQLNTDSGRIFKSIGTLGGGNHFISINQDRKNNCWLTVHSGSRNLGKLVCEYHMNIAEEAGKQQRADPAEIEKIKKLFKGKEIEIEINKYKASIKTVPDVPFLENQFARDYLKDMGIAQHYAMINRKMIIYKILEFIYSIHNQKWKYDENNLIESVHNYIDFQDNIIRKGSIRAHKGEKVLIPLNMRDGILLGIGKGNAEYNQSAPHGLGRNLSRSGAKAKLDMEEFKLQMENVYSTCVTQSNIDEAPDAYKEFDESFRKHLDETVETLDVFKEIYNFKSS